MLRDNKALYCCFFIKSIIIICCAFFLYAPTILIGAAKTKTQKNKKVTNKKETKKTTKQVLAQKKVVAKRPQIKKTIRPTKKAAPQKRSIPAKKPVSKTTPKTVAAQKRLQPSKTTPKPKPIEIPTVETPQEEVVPSQPVAPEVQPEQPTSTEQAVGAPITPTKKPTAPVVPVKKTVTPGAPAPMQPAPVTITPAPTLPEEKLGKPAPVDLTKLVVKTPTGTTTVTKKPKSVPGEPLLEDFPSVEEEEKDELKSLIEQAKEETPPTQEEVELGLPIEFPTIGTVYLLPFKDPETNQKGLKAQLADKAKKFIRGPFTFDDFTVSLIGNTFSVTGHVEAFGSEATFGVLELTLSEDNQAIERMVLGLHYSKKPSVEIWAGKSIILDSTEFVLEKEKPTVIRAVTNMFGKKVYIGLLPTSTRLTGFMGLPPDVNLVDIIPSVANTPLDKGIIKEAKITLNNIWVKKGTEEEAEEPGKKGILQEEEETTPEKETVTPTKKMTPSKAATPPSKKPLAAATHLDINNATVSNAPNNTQQNNALSSAQTNKPTTVTHKDSNISAKPEAENKPATTTSKEGEVTEEHAATEHEAEAAVKTKKAGLNAVLSGIINLGDSEISSGPEDLNNLTINCTISRQGIIAKIDAHNFPMPDIGMIKGAGITIDTTKKPAVMILTGRTSFDISDIGPLEIGVEADITTHGVLFAGEVLKEFNYANITLKKFKAAFDTDTKTVVLRGNVVIEDLTLAARLALMPDAKNPGKKIISFSANSKTKEFAPFENMTDLPSVFTTFHITDFDATVQIVRRGGKTIPSLSLNGDIYILGKHINGFVHLVQNDEGKKGVYMEVPFTKNQKLSDFLPELSGPIFDGIMFKTASLIASSINFTDEDGREIKKGMDFFAQVPLTGSLADAGKLLGAGNKLFTMYGTLNVEKPRLSEFGILLSQGKLDPNAKFSLGTISVDVTGQPSLSIDGSVIFRPKPEQQMTFTGKFEFEKTTVDLDVSMTGQWANPFDLAGWALINPALKLGMTYGSPSIPTEIGGNAELKIKDYLDLRIAFLADITLKNLAFEGSLNTGQEEVARSGMDILLGIGQSKTTQTPDQGITFETVCKIVRDITHVNIPLINIPDLILYDLYVRFATQDTVIGAKVIPQGIAAKAQADIFGENVLIDASLDIMGLKALGVMDPIDILHILKVEGRGPDKKPKIDIELSLMRQIFYISGLFDLAGIYSTETFFSFTTKGVEFNFEDKAGGDRFNWKNPADGKTYPLLL